MNSMPDDHLPVRDALSTDAVISLARERWRALGEVNALFTRPWIGLDTEGARDRIDRDGLLAKFAGPDLDGRRVLVIGGGGGQQSLAFGLLGASVTVVDFDEGQLERDRRTWSARLLPPDRLRTLQLDMRELGSCNLESGSFDIVWHPYSINFVPDCHPVIVASGRLLTRGGIYRLQAANPFVLGMHMSDQNGDGYVRRGVYRDGEAVQSPDPGWVYDRSAAAQSVPEPIEFRHTLATVVNSCIEAGMGIIHLEDAIDVPRDEDAEPGTWDHFCSVNPPWFAVWARRQD